MDKHVFISYKHDDSDFAENLIIRVQKEGFPTWLDNESLHPGDDWREGIDQAIRSSFALIVIMSPDAKNSEYVTYEWSFAWGCGIKVIPIMYKKTELHPRLESLQHLDFTDKNNDERLWDRLIKALKTAESKASATSKALQGVANQPVSSPIPMASIVPTDQHAQEWFDRGKIHLEHGEYGLAAEAFRIGNNFDVDYIDGYISRGHALCRSGKYRDALESFNQAILRDPDNGQAYAGKGNALWGLKKYSEALSASHLAIRLDAKLAYAWKMKGDVLFALKRYEETVPTYEQALRLDPDNIDIWADIGITFTKLGRYEEALSAYEEILRLEPDSGATWNIKGNILKKLGRSEEAEECYNKAKESGWKG